MRFLLNALSRARARALDLLYPGFCRECWAPLDGPEPFCPSCADMVHWITSACPLCGEPAINPAPEACGNCAGRTLHFDQAAAPCEYTGPWRTAVLRFKYLGDHGVRGILGSTLEQVYHHSLAVRSPEVIVPVPAHPWRKFTRGRDPVEELAVDLGAHAGLPVRQLLRRSRWISSQTSLPRNQRLKNPRGAYLVRNRYRPRKGRPAPGFPRSILILDDVLTTGATVSECARVLRQAGARVVCVLAAARSPAP